MEAVRFVTLFASSRRPELRHRFQAYVSVGVRIALSITLAYLEIVGGNSAPDNNGPFNSNVWQLDFAARADK